MLVSMVFSRMGVGPYNLRSVCIIGVAICRFTGMFPFSASSVSTYFIGVKYD